jgi:hypothetical protein
LIQCVIANLMKAMIICFEMHYLTDIHLECSELTVKRTVLPHSATLSTVQQILCWKYKLDVHDRLFSCRHHGLVFDHGDVNLH